VISQGLVLTAMLVLAAAGCATSGGGTAKLAPGAWQGDDFNWIRGANYVPGYARNDVDIWNNFDAETIDRELGYAASAGLNCVRVFMQIIVYEKDPEQYLENFDTFLALCDKHGITMMPVLFDSCFGAEPTFEATGWVSNPGFARVSSGSWPGCEKFVDDIVGRHIGDPRIALWDIMNEPLVAGSHAITEENQEKIWRFVRHFTNYVNDLDPTHATTVGVAGSPRLDKVQDVVRVLSFHSYTGFEDRFREDLLGVQALGKELGKAVFISEMCNFDQNQTYEMTLRVCRELNMGYFFWELMIAKSPFPRISGIFYPDGTVRSAEDLAAVLGFTERKPLEQVVATYNLPPDEFALRLRDALATPTWRGNVEDRLLVLYSMTPVRLLAKARFEEEHPEVSGDNMREQMVDDHALVVDYFRAEGEVGNEWRGELDKIQSIYKQQGTQAAYAKIDEMLAILAEKIGFETPAAQ